MDSVYQLALGIFGDPWVVAIVGLLTFVGLLIFLKSGSNKSVSICSSGDIVRPLGICESMFFNCGQHGAMLLINILFLRSARQLKEGDIAEALKRLRELHPLLKVTVKRNQGRFIFVKLGAETAIPICVDSRTNWKEVYEDQSHARFEENGLLWKVLFLPNARLDQIQTDSSSYQSAVIFLFNHSIIDGTSYMRLFNTFLDVLCDVVEERPTCVDPFPLLPCMEVMADAQISYTIPQRLGSLIMYCLFSIPPLFSFLMNRLLLSKNVYFDKFSKEVDILSDVKPKNCTVPLILSKEKTKTLLSQCKENKTTVQGAVQAASMIAAARLWKDDSATEKIKVRTEITLNIRGSFEEEVPAEALGLFIGRLEGSDQVSSNIPNSQEFWELARQISTSLHARLKQKEYLEEMKVFDIMRKVSPTGDMMVDLLIKQSMTPSRGRSPALLTYSNLGNCSFLNRSKESPVEIIGRFGMSTQHIAGAIFYNNLATINGQLFWNVVYASHIVPERLAQEFVDNILDILNMALNIAGPETSRA